jgi:hypothetical protein
MASSMLKSILRISVFDFRKLRCGILTNYCRSLVTLDEILEMLIKQIRKLVAYLSMGNPYGDPWDVEIVGDWTEKLSKMGVKFCLFPILSAILLLT